MYCWSSPLRMSIAVGDAVAVGDDEARPVVGLGLPERGERLVRVGAHGHPRDVDVAVGDRLQREVLLGRRLAGRGELGHGAERGGLRRLAAGVGVDLGVQDEHVDVAPAGEHVVEPAGADVVGPAVAADDPHGCAAAGGRPRCAGRRRPGRRGRRAGASSSATRSRWAASSDSRTCRASRMASASSAPTTSRSWPSRSRASLVCRSAASRSPRPNSALSSNSEFDQAGPRPAAFFVHGVVGRLPP